MLSYIANQVREYCNNQVSQPVAFCYYYCYFRRAQDETLHLVRWILGQLCRQRKFIPKQLTNLYQDGVEPTLMDLLDALSVATTEFHAIYIVIDALDETLNKERLLSVILRLIGPKFPNIRVLATGRKEPEMERELRHLPQLSLSNPLVDDDIKGFIESVINRDVRFKSWSQSLVETVQNALVAGAKGM
jgi:hypothetical protein